MGRLRDKSFPAWHSIALSKSTQKLKSPLFNNVNVFKDLPLQITDNGEGSLHSSEENMSFIPEQGSPKWPERNTVQEVE